MIRDDVSASFDHTQVLLLLHPLDRHFKQGGEGAFIKQQTMSGLANIERLLQLLTGR